MLDRHRTPAGGPWWYQHSPLCLPSCYSRSETTYRSVAPPAKYGLLTLVIGIGIGVGIRSPICRRLEQRQSRRRVGMLGSDASILLGVLSSRTARPPLVRGHEASSPTLQGRLMDSCNCVYKCDMSCPCDYSSGECDQDCECKCDQIPCDCTECDMWCPCDTYAGPDCNECSCGCQPEAASDGPDPSLGELAAIAALLLGAVGISKIYSKGKKSRSAGASGPPSPPHPTASHPPVGSNHAPPGWYWVQGRQWYWDGYRWAAPSPAPLPAIYAVPLHSQRRSAHAVFAWVCTVLTMGYMLPWGVAATRRTSNAGAVALVSFFLGWTIIGWFVALIMALMGRAATPQWVYRR